MHQIYRNASHILVWPGVAHFRGQKELAAFIDSFEEDHWNTTQLLLRPHNTRPIAALQDSQFDQCWGALEETFKAPYWNRLWIVQEVLSNSETWVYIGEELIQLLPLLAMGLALQYLDDNEIETLPSYTKSIIESIGIPLNLPLLDAKLHFSNPEARPIEFLLLLQPFRAFECQDPRDKVYGLVGLSTQYEQTLAVDYSKEVSEIHKDVARLIIDTTQRLEIICTDERTGCDCLQVSHDQSSSLPTWVPNWSCIRDLEGTALRPGLLRGRTADQLHRWNACRNSAAQAHISDDGNVLKCKGIYLGNITNIVRPVVENGPQDFYNILQMLCTTHEIYKSNQTALFKALRETLLKTGYIDDPVSRDLSDSIFLKICQLFLSRFPSFHRRDLELVDRLCCYLKMAMEDRCFYTGVTSEESGGLSVMGVTFMFSREGDVLAVLYGCRWPVLLRRRGSEDGDGFVILGEVYVNGFMNGEGLGLRGDERIFEIY